jgi:ubiquitin carboxyl-terminal hydrolase 10
MNADFDGTGRSMTRRSFIEKLPPILILHLKRFVYDGHGTKKVWKKIAYPLSLEIPLDVLSPTQRGDGLPKFQLCGGILPAPPKPRSRLTIVIYHHGTSATGGHYTADVLLQDGHTWLNLDDTKLKWVDAASVAVSEKDGNWGEVDNHQVNGDDGATGWNNIKSKVAYLLLYKRLLV